MKDKCNELWQKLAVALKPQVSADTFKRWFSAVELIDADEGSITFRVPNNIYQFWIESNHMAALQAAIITAFGEPREVKFSLPSGAGTQAAGDDAPALQQTAPPREAKSSASVLGLNPRNTFESFVVGPNNQFAHSASLAVAQLPARTYNPLFIYGGVGLGKTHMMQASGEHVW